MNGNSDRNVNKTKRLTEKSRKNKTQNKWQENKNYETSGDERKKEGIKERKNHERLCFTL